MDTAFRGRSPWGVSNSMDLPAALVLGRAPHPDVARLSPLPERLRAVVPRFQGLVSLSFDGPRQKQFSGAKCQETIFFCFQVGPWTSLDPEGGGFRKPPSYGWIQDEVRNWVRVGVRG